MSQTKARAMPDHNRTYLALRSTIGWIGIAFPVLLVVGLAAAGSPDPFVHSLSRYYHTPMHDLFVAGMSCIALFLFFYSGYDGWEDWTGNVAGGFAVGVIVFPVSTGETDTIGALHYASAMLLFLTLADYSAFLFPRNRGGYPRRAWVAWFHRACGAVMVGAIVAIVIHAVGPDCDKSKCVYVLVAETIAMWAFGLSWLIEGRELRRR